MKKYIIYFITIVFITCSIQSVKSQTLSKAICTANKVNVRKDPVMGNNVITQCNFGDVVNTFEVYPAGLGDRSHFFIKVKFNDTIGWINCIYVSDYYSHNDATKTFIWTVLLVEDGAYNKYTLSSYNTVTKQKYSKNLTATHFYFTDDSKYVAVDIGSYVVRLIEIYELPSLKLVHKAQTFSSEYGPIVMNNNTFIFNEFIENTKNPEHWNRVIFENGKIIKTGEEGTYKD